MSIARPVRAAIEALRATAQLRLTSSYMQPRVWKDDVYVVETSDGTLYLPADDVDPRREFARKLNGDPDSDPDLVYQTIESQLNLDEGDVQDVSFEKGKWLGHTTAPGYMDQTEVSMYDSEQEAWADLIENYPDVFTWIVEDGTAHVDMDSDAAAKAMVDAVQSVEGSRLERDGNFVYVKFGPSDMAEAAEMFEVDFDTSDPDPEVEEKIVAEMERLTKAVVDELEASSFSVEER